MKDHQNDGLMIDSCVHLTFKLCLTVLDLKFWKSGCQWMESLSLWHAVMVMSCQRLNQSRFVITCQASHIFDLLVCGVSELAVMVRCYRKTLRHWFDCLPALWKNLICSFPALIEKLPLLSKWQRTKARTAECLCTSGPAMEWGLDQGLHPPPQPSAGKAVRKRMTGRITKNKQLPLSYYYPK